LTAESGYSGYPRKSFDTHREIIPPPPSTKCRKSAFPISAVQCLQDMITLSSSAISPAGIAVRLNNFGKNMNKSLAGGSVMKPSIVKFAAIAFSLLLAGCAGTKFVRVPDDSLVLGQTTMEQIKTRLGSPYREGEITKNGQQLKTANYFYSSAGREADSKGVTPARNQGFIFYNDKLVGYEFSSSWQEDSTEFDGAKVPQIKIGESTRSDVVRLFGNPGGKYIYPLIPDANDKAINYLYEQAKGTAVNLKSYQQLLVVTFNKQDIVTNVEYTESGEK